MPSHDIHKKWERELLGVVLIEIDKEIDRKRDSSRKNEEEYEYFLHRVKETYGERGVYYFALHHILDRAYWLLQKVLREDLYHSIFIKNTDPVKEKGEGDLEKYIEYIAEELCSELSTDYHSLIIRREETRNIVKELISEIFKHKRRVYELLYDLMSEKSFKERLFRDLVEKVKWDEPLGEEEAIIIVRILEGEISLRDGYSELCKRVRMSPLTLEDNIKRLKKAKEIFDDILYFLEGYLNLI